jgi:hypothetical protein
MLSLLKVVMNLLLEGLDPFNQYSCMIFLSVEDFLVKMQHEEHEGIYYNFV